MTTMIEKVSAAMFDRIVQIQQSEGYDGHVDLREIAKAGVEAMMEPSEEMILAGLNCDEWAEGRDSAVEMLSGTFSTMISAALGEDRHG